MDSTKNINVKAGENPRNKSVRVLKATLFVCLLDARGRGAQDHGVHSLGELKAGPQPQHPTLPVRPGC